MIFEKLYYTLLDGFTLTLFVLNFSILTLADSENLSLTAFSVKYSIFGLTFWSFWSPRAVKMVIFEKLFYTLLDGYLNIISAKFQRSNPYRFRKLAFGSIFSEIWQFWAKVLEFLEP